MRAAAVPEAEVSRISGYTPGATWTVVPGVAISAALPMVWRGRAIVPGLVS